MKSVIQFLSELVIVIMITVFAGAGCATIIKAAEVSHGSYKVCNRHG